jgi:hypothetical protein
MASIRTTVVLNDTKVDELVAVIRRGQGGRPVIGRDRTTWIGLVVVALLSFAALRDLAPAAAPRTPPLPWGGAPG